MGNERFFCHPGCSAFAYTIPFGTPEAYLRPGGGVWGKGIGSKLFGGAATGFEPRTSCMWVRSRSHYAKGAAPNQDLYIKRKTIELGNESFNRCFRKLAEGRDLKNKWFAGGRRPLERKTNPWTVSKSTRKHLNGHNHIPATQVLKSQGWVKPAVQAVSHGNIWQNVHLYIIPCCFTWTCMY